MPKYNVTLSICLIFYARRPTNVWFYFATLWLFLQFLNMDLLIFWIYSQTLYIFPFFQCDPNMLWSLQTSIKAASVTHSPAPQEPREAVFQIISVRTRKGFSKSWVNDKSSCGGNGAHGSPPTALPLPSPCSASHIHLLLPLPGLHLQVWWP